MLELTRNQVEQWIDRLREAGTRLELSLEDVFETLDAIQPPAPRNFALRTLTSTQDDNELATALAMDLIEALDTDVEARLFDLNLSKASYPDSISLDRAIRAWLMELLERLDSQDRFRVKELLGLLEGRIYGTTGLGRKGLPYKFSLRPL